MKRLSRDEQLRVADAVKEVEKRTNAELVTVLAACSDHYRYIPLLCAACASLSVPLLLYAMSFELELIIGGQLGCFVVLGLISQISNLRVHLVPRRIQQRRAAEMARQQFLEQDLHHTDHEVGVLIFVSEAERYVEILVDRGISSRIASSKWQTVVNSFVIDVKEKNTAQGFIECLSTVGDLLENAVPKTSDNKNELDDRLILIGYD